MLHACFGEQSTQVVQKFLTILDNCYLKHLVSFCCLIKEKYIDKGKYINKSNEKFFFFFNLLPLHEKGTAKK